MNRHIDLVVAVLAQRLYNVEAAPLRQALTQQADDKETPFEKRLVELGLVEMNESELLVHMAREAVRACGNNALIALTSLMPQHELETFLGDLTPSEMHGDMQTAVMSDDAFHSSQEEVIPLVDEAAGRYTFVSDQGKGGMGRVLIVHDTNTDREVALKELLPPSENTGSSLPSPVRGVTQMASRFLLEGRVTAQLEHPSIVPVYEIGRRRNGTLYYTMKLVRGRTLLQSIRQADKAGERLKLLPHFVDLCNAIAYAHSRGVIHRDIKPANIMIGEFGETVVLDWGVAKVVSQEDVHASAIQLTAQVVGGTADSSEWRRTSYGAAIGTPNYMAPEQAAGRIQDIGPQSDVYALGVVLYELLSGTVPFDDRDPMVVLRRVLDEDPEPVGRRAPDAPPELVSIVNKAMARAPEDRYASAKELADEVQRFLTGAVVKAYEYRFTELARRYYRRHRNVVHTAAGAAAVVLLVLALAYVNIYQARNREREARGAAERESYTATIRLASTHAANNNFNALRPLLLKTDPKQRHFEWGYLMALCNQHGHRLDSGGIYNFQAYAHPDGKRLLALGADGAVTLWDVEAGRPLHRYDREDDWLRHGGFSRDGSRVVVAHQSGQLAVLDTETFSEILSFKAHREPVTHAGFTHDDEHLVTASADGSVVLWRASDGKELRRLPLLKMELKYAEATPDLRRVVSWSEDQEIFVWDLEAAALIATVRGMRVRISPDGRSFAHVDGDQVVLRSAEDGAELWRNPHRDRVESVAYSPDGAMLASASLDGTARLWDTATGKAGMVFSVGSPLTLTSFSPDGRKIAAAGISVINIWDWREKRLLANLTNAGNSSIAWTPDSRTIFGALYDRNVGGWPVDRSLIYDRIAQHESEVLDLDFNPRANLLATISLDDSARIFDAATNTEKLRVGAFSIGISRRLSFNREGTRLAATLDSSTPMVIDTETGDVVAQLRGHTGMVISTAYDPKSEKVATGASDRIVRVWDVNTGETLWKSDLLEGYIAMLAYNPVKAQLAAATSAGRVYIWDTATSNVLEVLTVDRAAQSLAFSPDGRQLMLGGTQGQGERWDTASWRRTHAYSESRAINGFAFSPDSRRSASAGADGVLRFWSDASDDITASPLAFGSLRDVAWDAEGASLFVGTESGAVNRLYAVDWELPVNNTTAVHAAADVENEFRDARVRQIAVSTPSAVKPCTFYVSAVFAPAVARALNTAMQDALIPRVPDIARLGLRAGDRVRTIEGEPFQPAAGQWALAAAKLERGEEVKLQIVRAETEIALRLLPLAVVHQESTRTLSKEEMTDLLDLLTWAFEEPVEALLTVNRDFNRRLGRQVAGELLDGIWLNGALDDARMLQHYRFGIADSEKLIAVNGKELHSLNDARSVVAAAVDELKSAGKTRVVLDVQRGEFTTARLSFEM